MSPPRNEALDIVKSPFATNGRNSKVATAKRMATKRNGGESSKPPLTTTKVPPHMIVHERRNNSARVLVFICSAGVKSESNSR